MMTQPWDQIVARYEDFEGELSRMGSPGLSVKQQQDVVNFLRSL